MEKRLEEENEEEDDDDRDTTGFMERLLDKLEKAIPNVKA